LCRKDIENAAVAVLPQGHANVARQNGGPHARARRIGQAGSDYMKKKYRSCADNEANKKHAA
jgi:hypothetical protein